MTRKEKIIDHIKEHLDSGMWKYEACYLSKEDLEIIIKALEQEPCREQDDYENEIEDLYNRLDIAEYDKERLREEVTRLEEKIKALEQEPKTDCISRAKTCDYIAEFINHEYSTQSECEMVDAMIEGIQHLPSVKQEPKTGHWIYNNGSYKCQFCGHEITGREEDLQYCCKCGARLESEVNNDTN